MRYSIAITSSPVQKEHWLARMKSEGLGAKIAVTADRKFAGMIQILSLPENLEEWGLTDIMFIGSKKVSIGPPPSTERLRRILIGELRRNQVSGISTLHKSQQN